jgi:hypothetical protein
MTLKIPYKGLCFAIAIVMANTLAASADVLDTYMWQDGTTINHQDVTGQFTVDETIKSIISDTTSIGTLCASGDCGLVSPAPFSGINTKLFTYGPPEWAPYPVELQIHLAFAAGCDCSGAVITSVTNVAIGPPYPSYEYSGGLSVPAPHPARGIPSLIALAGAALWLRRDWLRQALGG